MTAAAAGLKGQRSSGTWYCVPVLRFETAEAFSRRHVDGSFTSDVNKVLDSMAAKEYLLWVMTSKPSGER